MGNDMVGQVIDKFKEFRPNKTVMKIWNLGKVYIILGVKDPEQWEYEMDPYYMYCDGVIDGITYLDDADELDVIMEDDNLIYSKK